MAVVPKVVNFNTHIVLLEHPTEISHNKMVMQKLSPH